MNHHHDIPAPQTLGPQKIIVFEDMVVLDVIGWRIRGGGYRCCVGLYFVLIGVLNKGGSGMFREKATGRLEWCCHRAGSC